ncbi:hypothetical protein TWF706_010994 [Orbilia oligospora]|nr:hypothetical protein TWF706_010994 [Orbilia oligospora]
MSRTRNPPSRVLTWIRYDSQSPNRYPGKKKHPNNPEAPKRADQDADKRNNEWLTGPVQAIVSSYDAV